MISEDEGQDYFTGDNVQLAIGQGLLSASPLQLAVGYSTLANGGFVMKPEIVMAIYQPGVPDAHESGYADLSQARLAEDPNTDGEVVRQIPMPTQIHDEIVNGLDRVISGPGTTSDRTTTRPARTSSTLPVERHPARRQDRYRAGAGNYPWNDSSAFATFSTDPTRPVHGHRLPREGRVRFPGRRACGQMHVHAVVR